MKESDCPSHQKSKGHEGMGMGCCACVHMVRAMAVRDIIWCR
jgi:hypothetical protein